MDSAILSLLGAFVLSIIGLFAFIWSLRQGLLIENPRAASVRVAVLVLSLFFASQSRLLFTQFKLLLRAAALPPAAPHTSV